MNTLSWLIYLADVSGNLDNFFFAIMIASVISTVVWLIAMFCMVDEASAEAWLAWRRIGYFVLVPFFFGGAVLGSIVPSKDTVYAIAASEMGEQALHTPTADRAFRALNSWLDRQIAGEETPPAPAATGNQQR